MSPLSSFVLLSLLSLAACSSPDGRTEATDAQGGAPAMGDCASDRDCRDGTFCNGDEVCDPLSPAADESGCRPGARPCPEGMCDENTLSCSNYCPDDDGDGHESIYCGGDDCDDENSDRYPGNSERCDDVDQDCDPSTVGDRDRDGDGSIDEACCNGELCGQDCDDEVANRSRLAPEVCDGVDNDCNGEIDNGVILETFVDADFDGFGDNQAEPEYLCQVPFGSVTRAGDCDDGNAQINPALPDICDGLDSDCDGEVDDGADAICAGAEPSAVCVDEGLGVASCRALVCPSGFVDCDGDAVNGCEANLCDDASTCGRCGAICAAPACSGGVCPVGDPLPPPQSTGVVWDSATGSPIEGAEVQVVGACPTAASWASEANGSFAVSSYPIAPGFKAMKDGYFPTLVPAQSDIPLFSEAEMAGIATELGVELNVERWGIVIVDLPATLDVELTLSSPHQPPGALNALLNGGETQRVVATGVAPGSITVDIKHPDFKCEYTCDGPTSASTYVEAGAVVYVEFGNCSFLCVG